MSYVRTLLSEYQTCDWETVRRYLVEVPPSWRGVDPRFNKDLITLELWLSEGTRLHYENMPYMLAETVWLRQTRIECDLGECGPFNCYDANWFDEDCRSNEYGLYYRDYREVPIVKAAMSISYWEPPAPIILHVKMKIDQLADQLSIFPAYIIAVMKTENVSMQKAAEIIRSRR